jgi:inositol transport system ATP-binding protein
MENITKTFPGVKALDNVQLEVKRGTVHAVMGENGAGKSTLMKVIIGIHQPNEGKIIFKGKEIKVENTSWALNNGISMIHQELSPVPHMTVAENIFLGREPLGFLKLVDHKKMYSDTKALFDDLNIDINPQEKMANLSIANQQMVEIAKAISYNSDLVIMDEPTSAITESEVEHLFKMIRRLKENNVGIIYITHKMDEVFQISDYVTVLRDGQYIGTKHSDDTNNQELISMMVGRNLGQMFEKEHSEIGEIKLKVEHLSNAEWFDDVSFDVRRGEIFGIAGLMGAGRTELMETVFGVRPKESGKIYIDGQEVDIQQPSDAISHNMALLTEDRKSTGLYLVHSVRDNMMIANIDKYLKKGFLQRKLIEEDCEKEVDILDIKTPSLDQQIMNLSGGNQQKVLISRWLLTKPDILILDEPTRGIDVGAKAEIHKLMSALAKEGKTVIMISSELPEILGMSDRIMVMHEGKESGIITRDEATQEKILHLATGASLDTFNEEDYKN